MCRLCEPSFLIKIILFNLKVKQFYFHFQKWFITLYSKEEPKRFATVSVTIAPQQRLSTRGCLHHTLKYLFAPKNRKVFLNSTLKMSHETLRIYCRRPRRHASSNIYKGGFRERSCLRLWHLKELWKRWRYCERLFLWGNKTTEAWISYWLAHKREVFIWFNILTSGVQTKKETYQICLYFPVSDTFDARRSIISF